MTVKELEINYPLEKESIAYFLDVFTTMKTLFKQTVNKQMGVELPERSISDLCQIFFYAAIDLDKHMHDNYKYGIDLVNKTFASHLKIFRNDLKTIAQSSIKRGVPADFILEYLGIYYFEVHKKHFSKYPMIL